MSRPHPIFAIALVLATGCAEHLRLLGHADGWSTGVLFWPPPNATSIWLAEPSAATTLGEEATWVEDTLRQAGYADQRWFPVGAHYEHGFAVTTRLERVDPKGTPKPPRDRWLVSYPEAAGLRWLAGSTEPYLPVAGRYRVMLIAFTDLHIPLPGRPTRLDEATAMEAPGPPASAIPRQRRVAAGYRLGVYVYEYEAESADGVGHFVARDMHVTAAAHVARAGLSELAGPARHTPADR